MVDHVPQIKKGACFYEDIPNRLETSFLPLPDMCDWFSKNIAEVFNINRRRKQISSIFGSDILFICPLVE